MRRTDRIDLAQIDLHSINLSLQGERLIRDTKEPNLALRVRASGSRAWVVVSSKEGKIRRRSLGDARLMPVETARAMAGATVGVASQQHGSGASPLLPCATIAELLPQYLEYGERRRWKPSTGRQMESVGRLYILPTLGELAARDITPQIVAGWLKDIAAQTTAARMALSTLSGAMLYAEDHGLRPVGSNPSRGLRKKERSLRGRHLPPATVRALWRSMDCLQSIIPDACDAVRLLLLTGARKSEILGLGWDRIAGPRAILEDSKTGPRTIWLNSAARGILERRRETANSPFVFPATRIDGPLPTIDRQWRSILDQAGIPALRLHDLRHHFAAVGVSNGIDLKVVGQLLGHHDIDTTLGYAHLATASLTRSASRVSGYLDRSLKGLSTRNSRRKRSVDAKGKPFSEKEAANA